MKKIYRYILPALSACALLSCAENLEPLAEYDVKSYYHGSDPRDIILSFADKSQIVNLPFIGNTCLETSFETDFIISTSRQLSSEMGVKFQALPEDSPKLQDYKNYEFIPGTNVLSVSLNSLPAGFESDTVKLSVSTNGVGSSALLPLSFEEVENSGYKVSINRGVHMINVEGQQVVSLRNQFFSVTGALTDEGPKLSSDGSITLDINLTQSLEGFKLKLVRDESVAERQASVLNGFEMAPDNVFPELNEVTLDAEQETAQLVFKLKNLEQFNEEKKLYLPFRLVLEDANAKTYELLEGKGDVIVKLVYAEASMIYIENKDEWAKYGLQQITFNPAISYTGPYQYSLAKLFDGRPKSSWYVNTNTYAEPTITIDFGNVYEFNGIEFCQYGDSWPSLPPDTYRIFVSDTGEENTWTALSDNISIGEPMLDTSYCFKLMSVSTRYMMIKLLRSTEYLSKDKYVELSEIIFYK